MIKGMYLVYDSLNLDHPDGIEKKIIIQSELFADMGIDMKFVVLNKQHGSFWNNTDLINSTDFVYFRKSTVIDLSFIRFFKRIKEINPKSLVMMEIPTYPYEGEYGNSIKARLSLIIDHYYRKQLQGVLDYIVVTGADIGSTLWGIPAISIVNGIDVGNIRPSQKKSVKDEINIGCIARFSPWHGYERLIEGLRQYYNDNHNEDVNIMMVGEGVERDYYERLTKTYGLIDHVCFLGKKTGGELDSIYNEIDIGCCSLGRYKSGIRVIGDLKSREYMARGLPMILGCDIDVLQGVNYEYAISFPNDSTPIDIQMVVDYCKRLRVQTDQHIRCEIRKKAWELVDIRNTFKPVLDVVDKIIR